MILDNFVHDLALEIQKVQDLETRSRMDRSLGRAARLIDDGKEKEGLMILQRIKNELGMNYQDFYKLDDDKLI